MVADREPESPGGMRSADSPVLNPVSNGTVPETMKARLIDEMFDRKMNDDVDSYSIIKNVNTCSCEKQCNGYVSPPNACVLQNGYRDLRHSFFSGALAKQGTVL